jgi:hypothetical protein
MISSAWITGDERRVGALVVFSEESDGEGNEIVCVGGGGVDVRCKGLGMAPARRSIQERYLG